jgi:sugar/nucleoside kinase (ribokinase family)
LIVVKQGARGAMALLPDGSTVASPGYRVPVVDAIGAGDIFAAALIVARRQGQILARALDFANAAAALSVTVPGGRGAPTVAESVELQRRGH